MWMITLKSTGDTIAANSTIGLKTAMGNQLALSVLKIIHSEIARPQKKSTNVSTAPPLINTIINRQYMQSIPL